MMQEFDDTVDIRTCFILFNHVLIYHTCSPPPPLKKLGLLRNSSPIGFFLLVCFHLILYSPYISVFCYLQVDEANLVCLYISHSENPHYHASPTEPPPPHPAPEDHFI